MARNSKRRATRTHAHNRRATKRLRNSPRNQELRKRGLAAINDVRRSIYKTLTAAARAEGTTVDSIRRLLPGTLLPSRRGSCIRVKASDRYSALVEIRTNSGLADVMAQGSRERELAGRHRAAVLSVLRNKKPSSILNQFRGKTVGGHKLLTNPKLLSELAHREEADYLAPLYVPPEASV